MRRLFLISIALALSSCFAPRILFHVDADISLWLGLFLGACWLVLFVVGLFKFRKRGLWLLFGLPFVLFWPYVIFMIVSGCAHDIKACP